MSKQSNAPSTTQVDDSVSSENVTRLPVANYENVKIALENLKKRGRTHRPLDDDE